MKHLILLMIALCTLAAKAQMAEPNLMEADSQTVRVYLESHGWKILPRQGLHVEAVNIYNNEYVCFVFIKQKCTYVFGMFNDPHNFCIDMLLRSGWKFADGGTLVYQGATALYEYQAREAMYKIEIPVESCFNDVTANR